MEQSISNTWRVNWTKFEKGMERNWKIA